MDTNRPHTLREFQAMFGHIYDDKNREWYSDQDLVSRQIEIAGLMGEIARKDYRSDVPLQLSSVFSWLCGAANRLHIDLHEALWHKYPGVCSYCLKSENCICKIEHPSRADDHERTLRGHRRDRDNREPITLADHQAFHARLYSHHHKNEILHVMALHLVEEATEVSMAHRHQDMDAVKEEMADVLSRIFALATRLEFDLANAVWHYYPYECVTCHSQKCVCKRKI